MTDGCHPPPGSKGGVINLECRVGIPRKPYFYFFFLFEVFLGIFIFEENIVFLRDFMLCKENHTLNFKLIAPPWIQGGDGSHLSYGSEGGLGF